jgi:hypothetical protein
MSLAAILGAVRIHSAFIDTITTFRTWSDTLRIHSSWKWLAFVIAKPIRVTLARQTISTLSTLVVCCLALIIAKPVDVAILHIAVVSFTAIRVGFAFITNFALIAGEQVFDAHTMVARGLHTPFVCAALALVATEPVDVARIIIPAVTVLPTLVI